jgi:hypothetical protein
MEQPAIHTSGRDSRASEPAETATNNTMENTQVDTTNQDSQPKKPLVLNVLLHGAFAFVCKPRSIEALIPAMQHHVFRAGNWLGETDLRSGVTYELRGVDPGSGDFPRHLNTILRTHFPAEKCAHIRISFPIPRKIYSLRVADVPLSAFDHREDLEGNSDPQHVPTLQVFSYYFKDQNQLFLKANREDGHLWEPVLSKGFVNLHIFSAEDHFARLSNSEQDFNKCVELLGSNLRMNTRLVPDGPIRTGDFPDGVSDEETEDLATRTKRLTRLGRLIALKGDANLAWYGNDSLDGNPAGCGGPIGH